LGAGRVGELRRWYERALAAPGALSSSERAEALAGLGITFVYTDTPDPARTALTDLPRALLASAGVMHLGRDGRKEKLRATSARMPESSAFLNPEAARIFALEHRPR
jgi:hypothetical protein